jgi:hypothetical protein
MQKYMCTHTLPPGGLTFEQVCGVAEAAQHDPNVRGYRSFINLTEGKACCIMEAGDRETIAAWFERMNLPYDSIIPVELEGDRGVVEDARLQPATAGAG